MYKQPPAQHRFKKGTSGNPAGRPKKADIKNIELLENFLQTFILTLKKDKRAKDKITRIEKILDEKN